MLSYNLDIEKRSTWVLTTQNTAAAEMPFFLTEIGKFYAGPAYYTRRSGKAGYYLVVTHNGRGQLHMGDNHWDLLPGSALLIPCRPAHNYHTEGDAWVHSWMHLDGTGVQSLAPLLGEPVPLPPAREFFRQFAALIELAGQIDLIATVRISHGISALLTDMVLAAHAAEKKEQSGHHPGIEAALRFIEGHYSAPIGLADIAHTINVTPYHFVRLFRRQMGTTPYNYLIHYRINQSKQLLCTTDSSVADVAAQVGYPSESNFISQFRRLVGMTPAQFRRSNISYVPG